MEAKRADTVDIAEKEGASTAITAIITGTITTMAEATNAGRESRGLGGSAGEANAGRHASRT